MLGGIVLGLIGAYWVSAFYRETMPGLELPGPRLHAIIAIALVAAGATACYLPARKAARIDPVVALRSE